MTHLFNKKSKSHIFSVYLLLTSSSGAPASFVCSDSSYESAVAAVVVVDAVAVVVDAVAVVVAAAVVGSVFASLTAVPQSADFHVAAAVAAQGTNVLKLFLQFFTEQ